MGVLIVVMVGNRNRLPPGYTVKSITLGSIDLLKNHLTVEKDVIPPLIQVQIEAKP